MFCLYIRTRILSLCLADIYETIMYLRVMNSIYLFMMPSDLYMSRTTPLTSKHCMLYIYPTNVRTEYFKHALYSPFFPLQNAVCFIMLTCLIPVLFTFYIQCVLKLKTNNSGAKGLMMISLSQIT